MVRDGAEHCTTPSYSGSVSSSTALSIVATGAAAFGGAAEPDVSTAQHECVLAAERVAAMMAQRTVCAVSGLQHGAMPAGGKI